MWSKNFYTSCHTSLTFGSTSCKWSSTTTTKKCILKHIILKCFPHSFSPSLSLSSFINFALIGDCKRKNLYLGIIILLFVLVMLFCFFCCSWRSHSFIVMFLCLFKTRKIRIIIIKNENKKFYTQKVPTKIEVKLLDVVAVALLCCLFNTEFFLLVVENKKNRRTFKRFFKTRGNLLLLVLRLKESI